MLGARATRSVRALVTIITGAILWASIATVAFAADKTFSATVTPTLVAGASYGEGARASGFISLNLKNESNQARLGSANVTAPAGIVLTAPPVAPAATSSVGTANVVGGVLQLRSLDLAPGASVNVTFPGRVECGANHAAYVWTFSVKQANDFNGTGNDLTQVLGPTTNGVSGNCGIVFSKGPKSAEKAPTAITNAIYNPAGDPVTVTVMDGAGLDTVAWWSGSVSLAIGDDPSGGTAAIGGTTSGNASGGSVTLAPSISKAASGYSLLATAAPNAGASSGTSTAAVESANFNIVDDAGVCSSATSTCSAESQGPKTKVLVQAGTTNGASGDVVILSFNDPAVTAPSCGDGTYQPVENNLIIFNVTKSDGTTASGRAKTATLTLPAAFVTKSASKYQVCYQGATGPAMFLAACSNRNGVPCIVAQALDKDKNLVIVVSAPGGDPKLNF
jgi:hypothetical protein